jgi:DNA polymerase III sliding clamp (beta) subunit (PCNA family)
LLLRACPVDNFPSRLKLDTASMAHGYLSVADLAWVARAVSYDETRVHLSGVCLDGKRIVATDGHRLHSAPYPDGCEKDRVIVPLSMIKLALAMAAKSKTLTVSHDCNGTVKLTTEGGTVTGHRVEAAFPPVNQVIPSFDAAKVVLQIDALFLETIASLSTRSHVGVKLNINGIVTAESTDPDLDARATVPTRDKIWVGPEGDITTAVSASYLTESVCLAKFCSATLRIAGPLDPFRIDDGERVAVIMPIHV